MLFLLLLSVPAKLGSNTMLTHIAIANAKPAAKPYNLTDGDGLFVTVKTNGSKLWRFRYRFHKRQKTLHFGKFPSVSLADARERCEEARRHIAAGLDPALLKKQARDAAKLAAANTFRAVAEEWYRKCIDEGLADVTLRNAARAAMASGPCMRANQSAAFSSLRIER